MMTSTPPIEEMSRVQDTEAWIEDFKRGILLNSDKITDTSDSDELKSELLLQAGPVVPKASSVHAYWGFESALYVGQNTIRNILQTTPANKMEPLDRDLDISNRYDELLEKQRRSRKLTPDDEGKEIPNGIKNEAEVTSRIDITDREDGTIVLNLPRREPIVVTSVRIPIVNFDEEIIASLTGPVKPISKTVKKKKKRTPTTESGVIPRNNVANKKIIKENGTPMTGPAPTPAVKIPRMKFSFPKAKRVSPLPLHEDVTPTIEPVAAVKEPPLKFVFPKAKVVSAGPPPEFPKAMVGSPRPPPEFPNAKATSRGLHPEFPKAKVASRGLRPEFPKAKVASRGPRPEFPKAKVASRGLHPEFSKTKAVSPGPPLEFTMAKVVSPGPPPEFAMAKVVSPGPPPEFSMAMAVSPGPPPEFTVAKIVSPGPPPEFTMAKIVSPGPPPEFPVAKIVSPGPPPEFSMAMAVSPGPPPEFTVAKIVSPGPPPELSKAMVVSPRPPSPTLADVGVEDMDLDYEDDGDEIIGDIMNDKKNVPMADDDDGDILDIMADMDDDFGLGSF